MADFGLKRRYPEEKLHLDQNISLDPEITSFLTNFQLDAIRFLWAQLKRKTPRCVYNDGPHMGKRITLAVLLNVLVGHERDRRILVACDSDEAIVSWIFKLSMFGGRREEISVYATDAGRIRRGRRILNAAPITFVNFRIHEVDKLIREEGFGIIILDIPKNTPAPHLVMALELPKETFLLVIHSKDIQDWKSHLLNGLLRQKTQLKSWSRLRRTNEEHLREFPWIDQRKFKMKLEEWKAGRSASDILTNRKNESLSERLVDGIQPLEESQEMSQLLLETEDESTPIKLPIHESRLSSRTHLLSSMYLRISQSFGHTPKQQIIESAYVQDSPDLFASMMDDNEEEEDGGDLEGENNQKDLMENKINGTFDLGSETVCVAEDDTTNPFDKSTPLTPSVREIEVPSQSPIQLLGRPSFCDDLDQTAVGDNKTDVFEITTNEIFPNQVKVTRNNKHELVEEGDDLLKFDSEIKLPTVNDPPVTPTRKAKPKASSPSLASSSSAWLSKRTSPQKRTPEKVLAKKRRNVVQFYANQSSSVELSSSLDFATFEEHTQRWNAC